MAGKTTRAYFGDAVYAECQGHSIILTANGVGAEATDRIYLEPGMIQALYEWATGGYRDHNSGRTFLESQEEKRDD